MTLESYLELKSRVPTSNPRAFCTQCRLAKVVCDCDLLNPFSTDTRFILLMHPEESRRRIATGRLTHLLLKNSQLLIGENFANDPKIESILSDRERQTVILYPGPKAINLTNATDRSWRSKAKPLNVIVLDGTWRTARKMLFRSPNLHEVSQISFTPPQLSRFRIRKQPNDVCFSTLEAVHHLIGELEPGLADRQNLLTSFDRMVERQIRYAENRRKKVDLNSH